MITKFQLYQIIDECVKILIGGFMNKDILNILKSKNYIMPNFLLTNYKKLDLSGDLTILLTYLINLDSPIVCDYKKFSNETNISQKEVMGMINELSIKKMLEMYQEFKTNRVLLFYCLYKMYLKYPKNFEEVYSSLEISDNLINKIKKSDMTIILETQILETEKDIKEYIKNFITLHSNVFFIFPSLITIDNLLEIGAYDN